MQHVSKLNKQNFDLKLELFHRRQRSDAMEAELEKMKSLEDENAELHSINDDLLKELELRDVAVKEVVALICELEAKIEAAELRQLTSDHGLRDDGTPGPYQNPSSSGFRDALRTPPPSQDHEDQLSPLRQPHTADPHATTKPKTLGRPPSFLQEKKPSTSALRSVYQADGNPSFISLNRAGSPMKSNDPDTYTLNSPRLSMLSESSFLSVYGKSPRSQHDTSEESEVAFPSNGGLRESAGDLAINKLDIKKQRASKVSSKRQNASNIDNGSGRSSRGRKELDLLGT